MKTNTRLLPALAALISTTLVGGSVAAAEQAAPTTPFASAVQVSVVVTKPSKSESGMTKKNQKIGLAVKFVNSDTRQAYEGYTATISVLGQCESDTKVKKVLLQDEMTLSLPPLKSQEQITPQVTTSFESGRIKHGYSYYAWIVVVNDPQGKTVKVKSSATTLEKFTELASKLEKLKCYDSKLKLVEDPEKIVK